MMRPSLSDDLILSPKAVQPKPSYPLFTSRADNVMALDQTLTPSKGASHDRF